MAANSQGKWFQGASYSVNTRDYKYVASVRVHINPEKEEAPKYGHMMCGLDVLAHIWFRERERVRERVLPPPHFSRNWNLTML